MVVSLVIWPYRSIELRYNTHHRYLRVDEYNLCVSNGLLMPEIGGSAQSEWLHEHETYIAEYISLLNFKKV